LYSAKHWFIGNNILAAKIHRLTKSRRGDLSVYNYIFFTNILRILDERGMTKKELHEMSGVSNSFLSDLTTGNGNPSLKVMEAIATALDVPLPLLLESTDLDKETLDELAGGKSRSSLPPGYERVSAVLPEHKAFIVKRWGEETRKKLRSS
jgi:transcriptional regulator with XRE-family HTH domain